MLTASQKLWTSCPLTLGLHGTPAPPPPPPPALSPAPSPACLAAQLLPPSARVLELGCGVAALLACTVGPRVAAYLQSDMHYAAKLAEENLRSNLPRSSPDVRTI